MRLLMRLASGLLGLSMVLTMPALANDISNSTWSETDGSNNNASPNGWKSGVMLPSQVEPTARAMMGAMKRFYNHINGTATSGGTANAQTLTYSVAPTALVTGDVYTFQVGASLTNTGATTLNVNSLGATTVQNGGGALTGGELTAGKFISVLYDGTNFQLVNTPFTATANPIFNNSQMNEYAASLLNGVVPVTEYQAQTPAKFSTDALTGAVAVPNTATVWQSNAIAGYANSSSTSTNVVAVFGTSRALAASTKNWGSNFICADGNFAIASCVGLELDVNIQNASTTVVNGLSIAGASTNAPTAGDGIVIGPMGTGVKWPTAGLVVGDGAASNAILIGKTTTAGGANLGSQVLQFNYTNGSSTLNQYQAVVDTSQRLAFNTTAGSGLATILIDGTLLVNAATGTRAIINFGDTGTTKYQFFREATNDNFFLYDNAVNTTAISIASGNMQVGEASHSITLIGSSAVWAAPTGTPAASLCLDASNNIIKKTTSGSCI